MADTSLRRELDAIAMDLETRGQSKLASIVDYCNHEIHERKASTKPAPSKPKRKPLPASKRTSASTRIAGAKAALKDVRWARAELRDIAKEYKKLGSIAEARKLLRMAEDLAEDENELMEIAGPVVDADTAVEGEDLDLETPVEDDESDVDECVCDDAVSDEVYDEEAPETYDDTVEDTVEDTEEEEEEPDLSTVEAVAKEIRAIARDLRREGDIRNASIMIRLARECECQDTETEFAPSVTVIPLPQTDGGEPPIDSTNFALGDDENLLDFAVEVVSDDEEMATEDEVAPDESAAAAEDSEEAYVAAAASLKRTAKALLREGATTDARKLLRKASNYETIAKRRKAAAKR